MTLGYRLDTDDEDDGPQRVRNGNSSCDMQLSPREQNELFVDLCKQLRELGAVEVRDHGFRAVFPPPTPQLVAMPVKAKVQPEKPAEKKWEVPQLEGSTPEDEARRQEMARTAALVVGG